MTSAEELRLRVAIARERRMSQERLAAFRKAVEDFANDLTDNWTLDEGVRSAAARLRDDLEERNTP